MGTVMCLPHGPDTIITFLWEGGAATSDGLTKLSKEREDYRNIDYPRLTFSALRTQDLSGTNEHNFRHRVTTYSVSISVNT
jgi:hypothetical protein